jgi:hypothetical protein
MQKFLTWYVLHLKIKVRSFGCYVELLAMVLLALFAAGIRFPSKDNVAIGIVTGESSSADAIYKIMDGDTSLFTCQRLSDVEALKRQVERGELECGFVFAEDFDTRCGDWNIAGTVAYYCSGTTTKGAVAKESLYAALLEVCSRQVLESAEQELYGAHDAARMDSVMERFAEYLDSDEVFGTVLCETSANAQYEEQETPVFPVQGCVGLLIILIVLLYGLKRFETGYAYPSALARGERALFHAAGYTAWGTLPVLAGLVVVLGSGQSRGFWTELVRLLLLLACTVVWGMITGVFSRNYVSFLAQILIFVLVNVLICPVLFDIVTYVRAIKYIRMLFPLGIYTG